MSFESASQYLQGLGFGQRIISLEDSSATVEEAAHALGCEPKQIAKTMSFLLEGDQPILIVTAGDAKIDNQKYKSFFHQKAHMIPADQVEAYIGHAPGGVCPFAVPANVKVYLDISLKRFERVYPAAGNGHSAVDLTVTELEELSNSDSWVDVCKDWSEDKEKDRES